MKLSNLLHDDEAVSPVIGVILMVAVTVILAAVIASFVLGLGSTVNTAPQASFAYQYDEGSNSGFGSGDDGETVTVTHDGGDTIDSGEISVKVAGNDATSASDSWPSEVSAGDSFTVDESAESFNIASGDDIRVVWASQDTDKTSTLSSSSVP